MSKLRILRRGGYLGLVNWAQYNLKEAGGAEVRKGAVKVGAAAEGGGRAGSQQTQWPVRERWKLEKTRGQCPKGTSQDHTL